MPIFIRNASLDSRLQAVAVEQPARTSKHALAEAMLDRALATCEQEGNAEAWKEIGKPACGSTSAQQNGTGSRESGENHPNPSRPAMSKPSTDGDQSTPAQRANAA